MLSSSSPPLTALWLASNGKFVTDSAGTVLIENIDPGTTLVVKETRTKDNTYILDDTPQTARIKAGQTVTLEFRNQPKGSLIIHQAGFRDQGASGRRSVQDHLC